MSIVQCPKGHFYDNSIFPSCPNCQQTGSNIESGDERTIPVSKISQDTLDDAVTKPLYDMAAFKSSPVVGWLVCVEGLDRGRDFRLLSGRNLIGRSDIGKYQVNLSDPQISRADPSASIAFDEQHNCFLFSASPSGNILPYVDDEPVLSQILLKPFSRINIANTKMVFVPFCGEQYRWNDVLKE